MHMNAFWHHLRKGFPVATWLNRAAPSQKSIFHFHAFFVRIKAITSKWTRNLQWWSTCLACIPCWPSCNSNGAHVFLKHAFHFLFPIWKIVQFETQRQTRKYQNATVNRRNQTEIRKICFCEIRLSAHCVFQAFLILEGLETGIKSYARIESKSYICLLLQENQSGKK